MVHDRRAAGVTTVVWTAAVLRCGKQMEKLPHYHFSWIVSLQEQRQMWDDLCGDNPDWSHLAYVLHSKTRYWRKYGRSIEVKGRGGIRRKQLIDELTKGKRYWNLEGEALDRTVWRTHFGRGQTKERMNKSTNQPTNQPTKSMERYFWRF
jgi:hypothetical protein